MVGDGPYVKTSKGLVTVIVYSGVYDLRNGDDPNADRTSSKSATYVSVRYVNSFPWLCVLMGRMNLMCGVPHFFPCLVWYVHILIIHRPSVPIYTTHSSFSFPVGIGTESPWFFPPRCPKSPSTYLSLLVLFSRLDVGPVSRGMGW